MKRPERLSNQSLDARILSNTWRDVSDYLSDVRLGLKNQKSALVPILRRLLVSVLSQFTTLSRISARPAEYARMASARGIRSQPFVIRVGLIPLASFFIALGVAAQLTAGLGIGPGDMIVSGISMRSGWSFGTSALMMSGTLALVATLMGRAPRIGTLANVAMIGPLIDLLLPHLQFEGGVLARALHFSFGLWAIGIGIGCLMHARLGIGTHEALSLAISDHTGIPPKKVRLYQEIAWIVMGLSLGSQFGIGTFAVALFIGPAISAGARSVGRVLMALSSAIEAPEVAAHVGSVGY
ncbi:MAG: hypothetical protein HKN03_08980 [Acidimicrobiales bacterium]|nr:hypothetical protein [Acidimicrobiales bacterium]